MNKNIRLHCKILFGFVLSLRLDVCGIMVISLIFYGILFLKVVTATLNTVEVQPKDYITVALLKRKPFVFLNQNRVLKSMDVSIIENFGQKFNLHIDFLTVDTPVNISKWVIVLFLFLLSFFC